MIQNTTKSEEIVQAKESVFFYGAGKVCEASINHLKKAEISANIKGILVTDKKANMDELCGIQIKQIDEAEIDKDSLIIISTRENLHCDIKKVLSENGFCNIDAISDPLALYLLNQKDVSYWTDNYINTAVYDIKKKLLRFVPRPYMEYLVLNILDHCNLKCKGCDHFACIADPYFVPLETIENDVKRLAEIMQGDNIMKIAVMGGEPLLHPDLLKILCIVRENFPYTVIRLSTNGLILLNQSDEFWKVCREQNVTIVNTKYPLNIDYNKIKEKALKEQVKYQFFEGSGDDAAKTSFKKLINLDGTNDTVTSFSDCHISNYGNFLMEGKFYGCPFSCQSYRIFNKKFNKNLRMTQKDYLDIYEVKDMQELFDFSAKPRPYCRYCAGLEKGYEWSRSEQKISEWIIE